MDTNSLRKSLACYGQEHVMQHWDGLDQAQREHLYSELNSLNFEEMKNSYKDAMQNLDAASEKIDDLLQPLPPDVHGGVAKCDKKTLDNYQKLGLQQIGNDKVAVLLLAGGQGTRLGVPYPKGMYNVGLLSNKTLYQLQAERVLKVQRLAQQQTGNRCKVPWYIMTSEHTKAATDSFFQKHKYFGLQKDNIVIFEQNLIPCLTFDGKLILDRPDKIARAPDGNGGLYRALKSSGVLADMESRGIQYIHVYCVDNILVRMADPHFIGFCVQKGADCGAKVVEKVFPTESVGVVCKVDGIYQVVEYSEITQKTAERRNSDGSLTFNAGNICNHFFSLDFLKKVSDPSQEKTLKYHVAKKKIPFVDQDGQQCIPSKPNGIKMEKFVFDVFQFATNFAVWEVRREDEFSPLKNSDGEPKNTPTTCREALFHLHHRFITAAGGAFTKENGHVLNNNSCENGNGMGDGSPSSFASEMQLVNIKQEPEDIIVEPNFFQSITSTPSSHDQGQYEGQMWFSSDSGAIESLNQTAPVESMSSPMGGPSHMNFPQRSMTPFSSLKQMRAQQSIKRSIQSSVSAAKRAKNIQMAGASVPDGSGGGDEGDEQMLEMEQEGDSGSQEIESAPTPTALIVNSNVQNQMASRFASDIELLSDQRSPDIVIGESKIGEEVSITVKCEAEDSLSETAIIAAVPTTSTDSDDQNVFTNKEVGKCISRFAEVDNNEIIEFMTRGTNKHTQNKTTYDLKLLNSFLQQPSVDENRPIHEIPTGELCSLLCKFIMSVRKADGTDYEPNSLRGFMSSFERHLKYNNYGYSLASSHEFSKFRDVLRSKQKSLKQEGKGNNPNRAEPISEEEISLLWQCGQFGSVTPQSIINTMWFYFSIYFGLKSTVEHHDLRWGDVKLFTDSEENEYIEYQDDQVKARAGMVGARSIKPKIYANTDNPERCIVDVFKQYAAKRPPDYCLRDHPFYIATHTGIPRRGEYWFKRNAVGINKLTSLMKRMIESAGISSDRKLSNHSVRKHVMQKLNTSATLTFDTFV